MLQIFAIILLVSLAVQTTSAVHSKRAVFAEMKQTTAVQWLIWLYPLPVVLPWLGRVFFYLFYPLPIGALFFVPALVVARKVRKKLEISGHPGAKDAARAMDHVVTFGIMAIMGLLVVTGWCWLPGL